MNKQERLAIYLETVTICKQKFYKTKEGKIVMLPSVVGPSFFYKSKIKDIPNPKFDIEIIHVVNRDCIYAALDLKQQGLHPAMLNMANARIPGGGVLRGSAAQEEDIFRRTNLFESLYRYHDIGLEFEVEQSERKDNPNHSYPLDANHGGIYSKDVTVFRYGKDNDYDVMEKPWQVDVITVPAVRQPKVNAEGHFLPSVEKVEKNKIKTILDIAISHGNDSLVLGAFGCGAFQTPPYEMARCFKEVLLSDEYKNAFRSIVFAIIEDKNSLREGNKDGNFKPFKEVLEGIEIKK